MGAVNFGLLPETTNSCGGLATNKQTFLVFLYFLQSGILFLPLIPAFSGDKSFLNFLFYFYQWYFQDASDMNYSATLQGSYMQVPRLISQAEDQVISSGFQAAFPDWQTHSSLSVQQSFHVRTFLIPARLSLYLLPSDNYTEEYMKSTLKITCHAKVLLKTSQANTRFSTWIFDLCL